METSPTRGKEGVQAVDDPPFEIRGDLGSRRLVATAIHAGHDLRREVEREIALTESARLREEDPYTDSIIEPAALQVVANRSRFEVDLNRERDDAVYCDPNDAWGLHIWKRPLPERSSSGQERSQVPAAPRRRRSDPAVDQAVDRPRVSAAYAPRSPSGRSGPLVVSTTVCRSSSQLSSAPRMIT